MMQVPFLPYHFEHLPAYVNTFIWLGFNVACLVLSILFNARTKRKPFMRLFTAFLLLVIKDMYYVILDGAYLYTNLYIEFGMSPSQAIMISSFALGLPMFIIEVFAAILVLIAIIMFYRESKGL